MSIEEMERLRNTKIESYDDLLKLYEDINTIVKRQDSNLNKELVSILKENPQNFKVNFLILLRNRIRFYYL